MFVKMPCCESLTLNDTARTGWWDLLWIGVPTWRKEFRSQKILHRWISFWKNSRLTETTTILKQHQIERNVGIIIIINHLLFENGWKTTYLYLLMVMTDCYSQRKKKSSLISPVARRELRSVWGYPYSQSIYIYIYVEIYIYTYIYIQAVAAASVFWIPLKCADLQIVISCLNLWLNRCGCTISMSWLEIDQVDPHISDAIVVSPMHPCGFASKWIPPTPSHWWSEFQNRRSLDFVDVQSTNHQISPEALWEVGAWGCFDEFNRISIEAGSARWGWIWLMICLWIDWRFTLIYLKYGQYMSVWLMMMIYWMIQESKIYIVAKSFFTVAALFIYAQ